MAESEQAWLHKCGTFFRTGTERCPGCGRPLIGTLPQSLIDAAEHFEQGLGLRGIKLGGLVTTAYIAGWEAAAAAFEDAPPDAADAALPGVDG